MTSFANRSVRRCPTGRTGPLDNAKEAMMQFWSEPRRARRLSREETRLRQGRQLSEGGFKARARSPLCHESPPAAAGRMPRGSPTSCYRIGVEYPLRPPSMLGSWDECGDSVTARCFASSLNTFPKAGTLWRNLSKSIFGMIEIHCGARTNRGVTGPAATRKDAGILTSYPGKGAEAIAVPPV